MMEIVGQTSVDFMGKRNIAFAISGCSGISWSGGRYWELFLGGRIWVLISRGGQPFSSNLIKL